MASLKLVRLDWCIATGRQIIPDIEVRSKRSSSISLVNGRQLSHSLCIMRHDDPRYIILFTHDKLIQKCETLISVVLNVCKDGSVFKVCGASLVRVI